MARSPFLPIPPAWTMPALRVLLTSLAALVLLGYPLADNTAAATPPLALHALPEGSLGRHADVLEAAGRPLPLAQAMVRHRHGGFKPGRSDAAKQRGATACAGKPWRREVA